MGGIQEGSEDSIRVEGGYGEFRKIETIILEEKINTRLILNVLEVNNRQNHDEPVKISISRQKKSSNGVWEDFENFNQAQLKAGQEVKMDLSCKATHQLISKLTTIAEDAKNGLPAKGTEIRRVDPNLEQIVDVDMAAHLQKLLDSGEGWLGNEELVDALRLKREHEIRVKAVTLFERKLQESDWSEGEWQEFFEKNEWIFGYGLNYQYLSSVKNQGSYGMPDLSNKGNARGDMLLRTEGDWKFTVLVEIKKPVTALIGSRYRSNSYEIGSELANGIAQLQAQCVSWVTEGSRQANNQKRLWEEKIETYQPKGILVIGKLDSLSGDDVYQRQTFELLRKSISNIDVLTFDELLERAKFLTRRMNLLDEEIESSELFGNPFAE